MTTATTKTAAAATIQVVESLEGVGATVDAAASVIRGVKLIGPNSKNGRTYPEPVLRRAVSLYEGAKVNVDHPAGNPTAPRGIADRFGAIRSARYVEGKGVYGDLHFNPKHRLAEQVAWDAEHNPSAIGLSHNAAVRYAASGKQVIESIVSVRSVDLVADPATTSSLFESHDASQSPAEDHDMTIEQITLEELKAQRPDLVKALGGEQSQADELEQVKTKLADAEKKLAAVALEATIGEELTAAGLDRGNKQQVSDVFWGQLLATEAIETRKALIADRVTLVKEAAKSGNGLLSKPVTTTGGTGQATESVNLTAEQFARRVCKN